MLLTEVAQRVGDIFAAEFREAGSDVRMAPIYTHALIGMVTFVGQWWRETREPAVAEVATQLAALAWMGLRRLPKRPRLRSR